MSRESLLKALKSQYRGEMDIALANIEVYQGYPVGIGEHPEVAQALDTQIEKYATAKEKYEAVEELLNDYPQRTLTE